MHLRRAISVPLLAFPFLLSAAPLREVKGNTLVSAADPGASILVKEPFVYAGGQVIDVLKVAGAEQHFFVDAAPDRSIRRFAWIQFEHYYPDNARVYDFSRMKQTPVALGRLAFMGDVRVRAGYFTMDRRPGSDSLAAEEFLRAKGFELDGTFVTLRLFHLPDDTRRKELMIIYGEVVPPGASEEQAAADVTAHARAILDVR